MDSSETQTMVYHTEERESAPESPSWKHMQEIEAKRNSFGRPTSQRLAASRNSSNNLEGSSMSQTGYSYSPMLKAIRENEVSVKNLVNIKENSYPIPEVSKKKFNTSQKITNDNKLASLNYQ
jgi:hypothetical protein